MKEILMYSSQFCPYCVNAEKLLLNKGIKKIRKIMVDENPAFMNEMIKITGEKTVPQIFIGDRHIGGFEQLRSINNDGNLDKLIIDIK
ncbi:MAG: glutaredoxin 3 [Nitrosomonadales bacterium]|jgi:glutaredoxin 3|nr:glutaredoxin 3 [Nitrosomonadales bacterium]MBT3918045.1 glutaredoxin 3 [Nitrosomonadales bacterium]MBT4183530.1 glutaredoxin 3 [Nitrosomonadales bacterium]MBT4571107.1 glutaredoxin 3 [Nitrosomonadales bacterium]MBT4759709.1 glutaredoxin 3 [Nitrosomonadales bacterium]